MRKLPVQEAPQAHQQTDELVARLRALGIDVTLHDTRPMMSITASDDSLDTLWTVLRHGLKTAETITAGPAVHEALKALR